LRGKDGLYDLAEDWRFGGSLIADNAEPGQRREAFNNMLLMPRGTHPESVQWAAREFAKAELADHRCGMVLHNHQAHPHVHISVRAESKYGKRLNPRKTYLHRWRELAAALSCTGVQADKQLAHSIAAFAARMTQQPDPAGQRGPRPGPAPTKTDRIR
jgi:hypothetical protein